MAISFPKPKDKNRAILLLYEFHPEKIATKNPKVAKEEWFKLMIEKDRKIGHVMVYLDKTQAAHDFGNKGINKRHDLNSYPARAFILPAERRDAFLARYDLPKKTKWDKNNHIHLLRKGWDKSSVLGPDGYPSKFVCATYLTWAMDLPDYWTYNSDDLFELAIKEKWEEADMDTIPIFKKKVATESEGWDGINSEGFGCITTDESIGFAEGEY